MEEKKEEIMAEETKPEEVKKSDQKNVGMAVIAYIPVIGLIPLFTEEKNDPFVKFHVKQGLILLLLLVAINLISGVFPWGFLYFFGLFIFGVLKIAWFVLLIMGEINALGSKTKPLPYIGKYAEQWFKF